MKGERRERWLQTLAFGGVLAVLGLALFSALIARYTEGERPAGSSPVPTSSPTLTSLRLLPPPLAHQVVPRGISPYPWPNTFNVWTEVYALPEPSGILDPALAEDTTIPRLLFLGLTLWDEEAQQVVPSLAESWEVSADGLVYTFHLRRDVTWVLCLPGSGMAAYRLQREVTAADVVFAIERSLHPETGVPHAELLFPIAGARERAQGDNTVPLGVAAPDETTVRFTLTAPLDDFPRRLAEPVAWPVPEEVLSRYGEKWTAPGNIWVNGAFCPVEWEPGREIVLWPNLLLSDPKITSRFPLPVSRRGDPSRVPYPQPTP